MFEKLRRAIAARHLIFLERHARSELARVRQLRAGLVARVKEAHADLDAQEARWMCRVTQLAIKSIDIGTEMEPEVASA